MSPLLVSYTLWAIWFVSWMLAAAWSDRTESAPSRSSQLADRLLVLAGILLLFGFFPALRSSRLWHFGPSIGWLLTMLTGCGFAFCWWARLHLGRLWSGTVTRKVGHHVVDSGPYALVRHPIYTGIIIASFATAIQTGTGAALAGAVAMTVGWYLKARLEERFLRAELGREAYDAYARRTAMLAPFLKF